MENLLSIFEESFVNHWMNGLIRLVVTRIVREFIQRHCTESWRTIVKCSRSNNGINLPRHSENIGLFDLKVNG